MVTGAGPIGLLAALLAVRRGLETHVLDVATTGPKPDLVRALGATYHTGSLRDVDPLPDIIVEATGAERLVFDAMCSTAACGIVCLTGVSPAGRTIQVDAGALNTEIVLENDVVFGSVNANRRHYDMAADALARADGDWLARLITRRVPLDRHPEAFTKHEDDIKVVIELR
jgi:threonine dehydrogenase-like Zn-dependent dehydrogenase